MRDVHGLAAGRNEFRHRGSGWAETLAVPGLNCDLFRNARAVRAAEVEFCDLSNLTAIEAVRLIAKGELRAEEYALRLIERHRALKSLNAVTWMDEERVLESARAIDERRARGEPLGALGGLPVIINDSIDVAGTVVQRLFDAGAVFFGKASEGTAAAIAARLVPAGLDTDTIMAHTVADIALLHSTITGKAQAPPCDLRATRIGVPTAPYWVGIDPEVGRVARNALIRLQAAGATLVDVDARRPATNDAAFAERRLTAIVSLSRIGKFLNIHVTGVLGAPGLSIPAGLTAQGLPVGLQFDALSGYDSELLALGIAVEQAWPRILPPQPVGRIT